MSQERLIGEVLWYNFEKGYGVIQGVDGSEYFLHHSNFTIQQQSIEEGKRVAFFARKRPKTKGSEAYNLTILPPIELNPTTLRNWIQIAHDETKPFNDDCCVYILEGNKSSSDTDSMIYKIGRSINVYRRLRELRRRYSSAEFKIDVYHTVVAKHAIYLERMLHKIYDKKCVLWPSWEWFALDQDDLNWLRSLRCVDEELLREIISQEIGRKDSDHLLMGWSFFD